MKLTLRMCAVAVAVVVAGFAPAAVAAVKNWDNEAGNNLWHDPLNWSPNGVPGPSDDVVIATSASTVVDFTTGLTTVNSLSCNGTLIVHGGELSVATTCIMNAGSTLSYQGGTITATPEFHAANLILGAGGTGVLVSKLGGNSTLTGNVHAGQVVWVSGGVWGHANLTLQGAVTNSGTIRMQSVGGGWTSNLLTGGNALVNDAAGLLEVNIGTGGVRTIYGGFTNYGTVNVELNGLVTVEAAGAEVLLAGGTVNASGKLRVHGGTLHATGGQALGHVTSVDGSIDIEATVTQRSFFESEGSATELIKNASAASQVKVTGGTVGHAHLHTQLGAFNDGAIVLESQSGGWESVLRIGGGEFVNNGTIDVRVGSGGPRYCKDGVLVNAGSITVEGGQVFSVSTGYEIDGGVNSGDMRVADAQVFVTSNPPAMTEVVLVGANNTLLTDNLSNVTLWVKGGVSGHGKLWLTGNTGNEGVLRLESVAGGWNSALALASGVFANYAKGSIVAGVGTGGPREYFGNLNNHGTIHVHSGIELNMYGWNPTPNPLLNQFGGSITADGRFRVQGGTLYMAGGETSGLFSSYNGTLQVDSSVALPSFVQTEGTTTLNGNLSTATTVHVLGGSLGHGVLKCIGSNAGTIRLQSINGGWDSVLDMSGGPQFTNNGTIEVLTGTGGARRSYGGTLANAGTIDIEGAMIFQVTHSFVEAGGVNTNRMHIYDAVISETASPGAPTELTIIGAGNTLVTNNLANVTLAVRGGISSQAILNCADGLSNHGTILLESQGGAWQSGISVQGTLAGSGTLTNASDGLVQVSTGSGGPRNLTGSLVNAGTLAPGYPSSLNVIGDFTQQATGSYQCEFDGPSPGQFSTMHASGIAMLGGTITAKRGGNYFPAPGFLHTVVSAASRVGTFINAQSCEGVLLSYTATTAALAFTETSGLPGDISGDGIVDGADLGLLLGAWGSCTECCIADFDENGIVDGADLGILLGYWS